MPPGRAAEAGVVCKQVSTPNPHCHRTALEHDSHVNQHGNSQDLMLRCLSGMIICAHTAGRAAWAGGAHRIGTYLHVNTHTTTQQCWDMAFVCTHILMLPHDRELGQESLTDTCVHTAVGQ